MHFERQVVIFLASITSNQFITETGGQGEFVTRFKQLELGVDMRLWPRREHF